MVASRQPVVGIVTFMVTLLNPLGLLALLALPVLVVIHCLRRRSRVVTTPVLFLVERAREPDEGGRRLRRFRGSPTFWLQALALLLLALLLAGLHVGHLQKVARVAVVVDSSASVLPCHEVLVETLVEKLATLASGIETTEFTVLDSYPGARPIYHGTDLRELTAALGEWRPGRTGHDPTENIEVARSIAGEGGMVIFASDRELPGGQRAGQVAVLAVGEPRTNVGFLGVDVAAGEDGAPRWRAIVRNYANVETRTSWHVEVDGVAAGQARNLVLPAGGMVTVAGSFPEGREELTLALEPDAFPLDDRLPVVRPAAKQILLASRVPGDSALAPIVAKLAASLPDVQLDGSQPPDCEVVLYDPLSPGTLPQGSAMVFLASRRPGKLHTGRLIVTNHPLVADLVWESAIIPEGIGMPLNEADEVLVWAGDKPLLALRSTGAGQLLFNFDVAASNTAQLPAFALICHRFMNKLRRAKTATEAINIGVGQRIEVTGSRAEDAPPLEMVEPARQPRPFHGFSPDQPGLFTLRQGDVTLIRGAVHFEDTEEADLRGAGRADTVPSRNPAVLDEARRTSSLWRLMLLAALAAVLGAWHFQAGRMPSPSSIS